MKSKTGKVGRGQIRMGLFLVQEIKMMSLMSLENHQESEAGNNLNKFSFLKFEAKVGS